ncbi:MAG: hypothetical protein Q9182_006346 [Xanthomendoza sp. 2 TL-2023]
MFEKGVQSPAMGAGLVVGAILIAIFLLFHRIQSSQVQFNELNFARFERSVLSEELAETLPDSVFFDPESEREIVPQCIVRPRSVQELATTLTMLKRDYDTRIRTGGTPMVFAVRSGGHSPMPGSANTHDRIVIDLRLLNEVVPSDDGLSVTFGTGARWLDVYKALDERGLAVAGGRNSDVGVGGLTLGGKCSVSVPFVLKGDTKFRLMGLLDSFQIPSCDKVQLAVLMCTEMSPGGLSFFSPRVGFVCNNILSYEIVLANGIITTASESTNPGLWRALKGGSNNFGIVTSFVARTFPSTNVWSGFLYMRGSKADQMVRAFYQFTQDNPSTYDEQLFTTTTVKNDLGTLREVHAAYKRGVLALKLVTGMTWTLILQPLLPVMARKGQADSQGLAGRTEPLVIVLFTVVWERKTDDDLVHRTTRDIIDEIDEFADVQGTADPYRCLNDCASWQNPFDGYGAENKRFLQQMSKMYDANGLFQRACSGGFKLGIDGSH